MPEYDTPDTPRTPDVPPAPPTYEPASVPSDTYIPRYEVPAVDRPAWSAAPQPPAPGPRRWRSSAVVAAAVLGSVVGAVVAAAVLAWAFGAPALRQSGSAQPASQQASSSARAVTISNTEATSAVTLVADKVLPSVVNVAIEQSVQDPWTGAVQQQESGNGSGVIIRSDGYILTNNHVVEGADRVLVQIGTEDVAAKVVGRDTQSDLAVVKVDRKGLPAAELGDSSKLQVGELAVAIGSPFGLEKTVTSGIVSALGRTDVVQSQGSYTTYTNLIQTDAPINPGNSGGALVNAEGQVIGINSLIESTSGSSAGIGFAIPINTAKDVADQLIATGKVAHPFLGISMATVDRQIDPKLPVESAVLVRQIISGSPAEKAGVKVGDLIVSADGKQVTSYEDFLAAIRARKVGDKIPLEIYRGTKRMTLQATLAADTSVSQ